MKLRLLCLTAALSLTGTVHANLLTNPSFEAVDVTSPPYYLRSFDSTPGWTQFGDGVDLLHNPGPPNPPMVLVSASDGLQFLDMNQAGANGGLFQTVAATVGTVYNLSLDTTAWATNSIGGRLGYQLYDPASSTVLASGDYTDTVGGTWITRTLSAAATSNNIGVRIESLIAPQAAMGLDNVVLTAVPEPGTWALMLGGLAAVAGLARRRRC